MAEAHLDETSGTAGIDSTTPEAGGLEAAAEDMTATTGGGGTIGSATAEEKGAVMAAVGLVKARTGRAHGGGGEATPARGRGRGRGRDHHRAGNATGTTMMSVVGGTATTAESARERSRRPLQFRTATPMPGAQRLLCHPRTPLLRMQAFQHLRQLDTARKVTAGKTVEEARRLQRR